MSNDRDLEMGLLSPFLHAERLFFCQAQALELASVEGRRCSNNISCPPKPRLTWAALIAKLLTMQLAVEEAKKLSMEAQQQASSALMEKSSLELETADLRRQCADLKHKASTLTVSIIAEMSRVLPMLLESSSGCPW